MTSKTQENLTSQYPNQHKTAPESLGVLISNIHQNFPPKTPISNLGNHKFGKPLFFEHLPQVQFRHSNEGVLFCLFETGEALFYPLNEQTKGNQPTSAKMLTQEPTRKKSDISNLTSKQQETSKFFVYDVSLSLNADLYRVNWNLKLLDSPPRKILLSPNKNLLLIIGAEYKGNSCLLVYSL